MDCRTRSRILHWISGGREMGEERGTAPYHLHEFEGPKGTGGGKRNDKQKTPNQTTDNSKCHTQSSTHMTTARASPFQTKPRTHDFPCAAPSSGQDVSFAGHQTTESRRFQLLSGLFYPADRLIGFRNVGSRFTTGFW